MSTTTTNYNLVKPALTDAPPDITVMNPNWDTIDTELKALKDNQSTVTPEGIGAAKADLSNVTGILPVEKGGTGKTSLDEVKVGSAEWASWATHMGLSDCSNKDFNTLKTPGYYFGYTNMTNAAFNEICVLEVIPYTDDWVLQRQTRLTDGKTFCRYFSSGTTWSAWYSVLTTLHKPTPADITAGTFSGYVAANASGQHYGTGLLRNTKLVSADTTPTVDGEIFWTYK